jgi:hypothetical protein
MLRRLGYAFLILWVVILAIGFPTDMGWIGNDDLLPFLRAVVFFLGILLLVLLLVIIWICPETNRYQRTIKRLLTAFFGLLLLGGIARRFGLSDWIERQGRVFDTGYYVLSRFLMMALGIAWFVMWVKDLQERTTRDIRAKLGTHETNRSTFQNKANRNEY